jgi:hypothetical protein
MMVVQRRVKKLHNFWWIVLAVFIGACVFGITVIIVGSILQISA